MTCGRREKKKQPSLSYLYSNTAGKQIKTGVHYSNLEFVKCRFKKPPDPLIFTNSSSPSSGITGIQVEALKSRLVVSKLFFPYFSILKIICNTVGMKRCTTATYSISRECQNRRVNVRTGGLFGGQ